jgi:hypothetical protein
MRLTSLAVAVLAVVFAQPASAQAPAAGAPAGAPAAPGSSAATGAAPAGAPTSSTPAAPGMTAPAGPSATTTTPAAAPPTTLTPTTTDPARPTTTAPSLGIPPTTPLIGSGSLITPKQAETLTPTTGGAADEWKFEFHGYLRAPLRVGFGPPNPIRLPSIYTPMPANSYDPRLGVPAPEPGREWHSPPRVPGYLYTTWEYTNTVTGPWTQLNFSYGNSRAMATVIVNSYAVTDGGYRHLQAQQGIDQAFLTLNFPDALGDLGTLTWNLGTFQNRYGTAGKYDGGMYETYLFGRTHMSGETLTANFSDLDAAGDWAVSVEHGVGAKIEVVPFFNNQHYQLYTNVPVGGTQGSPYTSDRSPDYLPYSGSVPQGSTFVHHAHIGAKFQKLLTFGLHYIFTWTPDDNWHPINSRLLNASDALPRANGPIQGSIEVTGGEVRLNGGVLGDGYLGYSHIDARNIAALAESLEVLHSYGGTQLKQNFFGRTFNARTGEYQGPQNETGTIHNLSLQYSFSFGQYSRYPEDFWGDGPDLLVTAFGLLSVVDSKAPPTALVNNPGRATSWDMSTKKLKFGLDVLYTPLYWLGFGARYDNVQPDIDGAYARVGNNPGGSELSFQVVNARLLLRTQFVTHEAVTIGYAHYFLGEAASPPYPFEWLPKADSDLVSLSATMWW